MFNKETPQQKKNFVRANLQIRVPNVRVVRDGEQLGVMPTIKAFKLAEEDGLDLIEVVPQANPPVCHIADLGKYRFEQSQKEKEQRKKQRESMIETKEVRFRPVTNDHDIETKIRHIKAFLEEGDKVQLNVEFKKNRELAHQAEGYTLINKVLALLEGSVIVEMKPKMEGRRIFARIAPLVAKGKS